METDDEKGQYDWDYRRSSVIDGGPLSLEWSHGKNVAVSVDRADARVGRPLTATSVAGVHRRAYRRAYYY